MSILLVAVRDMIIVGTVLLTFIIFIFTFIGKKDMNLEKRNNSGARNTTPLGTENTNLKIKEHYIFQKEISVFDIMQKHYGMAYFIVPKVVVKDIVMPKASRVFYELVANKVLDFVFFERATLHPVLVVDVFDNSYGDESLQDVERNVITALRSVRLDVVSIPLRDITMLEDTVTGMIDPVLSARRTPFNNNYRPVTAKTPGGGTAQNAEILKQNSSQSADTLKQGSLINAGSLKTDKK